MALSVIPSAARTLCPGRAYGARNLSLVWRLTRTRCGGKISACFLLGIVCACAFSSSLFAQTCALCYEQAAQAGARTSRAIDHGILVLLVPTLVMFVGVLVFAVRRANSSQ